MTMLTDLKPGQQRPLIDLTDSKVRDAGMSCVWQISALFAEDNSDTSAEYQFFSELAALAKKSPALSMCCEKLIAGDWCISYAQEAEEAELDFEERHIMLPGYGLSAATLNRQPLQKILASVAALKAFRLAEHHIDGLSEELLLLAPDQWLQFARAQAADIDVFVIASTFQARTESEGHALWRYVLGSDLYALADNFARRMPLMATEAHALTALRKAFVEWHKQADLVAACDRAALDRIDIILPHIPYPTRRLNAEILEALCCVAFDDEVALAYLSGVANIVLRMPESSEIKDPIVAAHLFQIVEENNVYHQGAVKTRDPVLAKALFN